MALKPNYSFERRERERMQAIKATEKANAKKAQKEADRAAAEAGARPAGASDET